MKAQEGFAMNTLSIKKLAFGIVCAFAASAALFAGAPTVQVSGTVTDGSGHGWPLFARIEFTSASTEPVMAYSDPVTGAYATSLADGTTFTTVVTAVAPGYAPAGGTVVTAGAPVDADWTLFASALCDAPGYAAGAFGPPVFSESFDGGVLPPGWTVETSGGSDWKVISGADPCGFPEGNQTGGSGAYAIANGFCDFFVDTYLVTPPIDLSASGNAAIRWANDFADGGNSDTAEVEVSIDGGATWTSVWRASGSAPGPGTIIADMSFAAGQPGVQVRFHYAVFFGLWWEVDDVAIGPVSCSSLTGGLLVGSVSDANTGLGLSGATVTALADGSSTTTAPAPGQGDGYYTLFAAGSGSQDFQAEADLHTSLTRSATITPDAVVRLDFALPAGLLGASPRPLSASVSPGATQVVTLDITNSGTGDASFSIHEVNVPPAAATGTFATIEDRLEDRTLFRRGWFGATGSSARSAANAPIDVPLAAGSGNVVSSFEIDLEGAYGLTYDTDVGRLWITNSSYAGDPINDIIGDGLEYQYQPDGTQTGETIEVGPVWYGDGAYDARTGMIWQPNVAYKVTSPNQCLVEIDPAARVVTGKQICGPWGNFPGLIGLAYDYATDTYYAGDQFGVITQVDNAGNVIGTGSIGMQISGLAYNPTTGLLYVATFRSDPFDIYVVDPHNGYEVLSGFDVTSGGVPVLNGHGVSLEADCLGHLWIYDVFNGIVFEVESGSRGWCVDDIPWLSLDPVSGTIPGSGGGSSPSGVGNTLPVTATFNSAGLLPGLYMRSLVFTTDTPDPVAPVPVDFTVLFNDVPEDSFAWNFIYGAAGAGVMPGCNPYAPAYAFCPAEVVTRRSMAAFIERAVHGALTPPPVYLGEFDDVLLGSFNADYIQGLIQDGITAGCSVVPRLYCPDVPVTRGQMSVFVWKGLKGDEAPPPCTGVFADVPCPSQFADYIEGIYDAGITVGCSGGNYCPNASITNAQMAVYLVKAFGLPYLPLP